MAIVVRCRTNNIPTIATIWLREAVKPEGIAYFERLFTIGRGGIFQLEPAFFFPSAIAHPNAGNLFIGIGVGPTEAYIALASIGFEKPASAQ